MSTDPLVRLDGISKRFGDATALHELNLDIARGEFVTFLGPSGCGKSTTLRILGGFEKPSGGRVILDGEDVTDQPPEQRHVNMVFQDYALFPHMTVRRERRLRPWSSRGSAARPSRRVRRRSWRFWSSRPMATAIPASSPAASGNGSRSPGRWCSIPALLLLDEPLGALDAKLRGQVQRELKTIQRRTNKTFFFVTHDQDEALTMSDRIVVLNKGRIEQDGTPEELYFHPASRFVAEFIGETNLLSGRMRGVDGPDVVLDWHGRTLRGRAPGAPPSPGAPVTASVRLEQIRFHDTRPETGNAVEGRITGKTFLGSRVALDLAVPDAPDVSLRAYLDPASGQALRSDALWIGWDTESMSILSD